MNLDKTGIAIAFLLLSCAPALAGTPATASYRVRAPEQGGAAYGSGTAISPKVVVTNSHVVGHQHRTDLVVIGARGERYDGKTIAVNQGADIALVWCQQANFDHVALAQQDPQPGDLILKMGYGGEGQLMKALGRCQGIDGYIGNRVPVIATTCETVSGDSGGGNFNEQGELCSVTWGSTDTSGGHGRSTPASAVYAIALAWQTQYCPDGSCPIVRPRGPMQRPQQRPQGGRQPVGPNDFNPAPTAPPNEPGTPGPPPADDYANQPDPKPPAPLAPTVPAPTTPAPKGCECDQSKLLALIEKQDKRLECLESLVTSLAERQPEKGECGPKGDAGPAGPQGEPGPAPDVQQLVEIITAELSKQPIRIRVAGMEGEARAYLGGPPVFLKLSPKKQ